MGTRAQEMPPIQIRGPRFFDAEKAIQSAYKRADENGLMSVESIAATLPNRDLLLEHLQDPFPG